MGGACPSRRPPPVEASHKFNPIKQPSVKFLVEGGHIRRELADLRMDDEDVKTIIAESTSEVREVFTKHPVILFGWARLGKSSLAKALLRRYEPTGVHQEEPKVGHVGNMTREVESFHGGHCNSSGKGEVILLDTPGHLPSGASSVLENCKTKILSLGVSEEVFFNRLIFVWVVSCAPESLKDVEDPMTLALMNQVRDTFLTGGKDQCRPVLQLVITKQDVLSATIFEVEAVCKKVTDTVFKDKFDVKEPIWIVNKDGEGNVDEVFETLNAQIEESLNSATLRKVIVRLIAEGLVAAVKKWSLKTENIGLESVATLARRCAMAIALSHGAEWGDLPTTETGWPCIEKVRADLAVWRHPGDAQCPVDASSEELHRRVHRDIVRAKAEKTTATRSTTGSSTQAESPTQAPRVATKKGLVNIAPSLNES